MSLGTLFASLTSPRSIFVQTLAQGLGLDVKIQNDLTVEEFTSNFPLKCHPAFLTSEGIPLTETIAIAYYFVSQSKTPELLGTNELEKALALKWLSFLNSDLFAAAFLIYGAGDNQEQAARGVEKIKFYLDYINGELTNKTYLVSENENAADIFLSLVTTFVFQYFGNYIGEVSAYPNLEKHNAKVQGESKFFQN